MNTFNGQIKKHMPWGTAVMLVAAVGGGGYGLKDAYKDVNSLQVAGATQIEQIAQNSRQIDAQWKKSLRIDKRLIDIEKRQEAEAVRGEERHKRTRDDMREIKNLIRQNRRGPVR